jgi:hypothetical protein
MKKFVHLAAVLTIVVALLACSKKPVDPTQPELPKPEPSRLFKPTMSYWNFEKTRRELNFNSWDTIEDRTPLISDKRPPFRLLVIRVPQYKDHGFTGALVLWFYNDRLMKTQFYVPNIKEYLAAAGTDQQVSLSNDLSGGIPPHTRVWMGKDDDGQTYIAMEDQVLKDQMDNWIIHYSNAG